MKMWGGRFEGEPDALMRRFSDSFGFDRRLYGVDIRGSIAYAGALAEIGVLSADERRRIVEGLEQVRLEFDEGRFGVRPGDEDVHTAVERRLTELVGPVGGKLHTGRSRNDQVALDLRLWMLETIDCVQRDLAALQRVILDKAEAHLDLIMPGYTHLQPAQPVLFGHWLMSFFWMLARDRGRLADCRKRTAISPLGAGALAGNPFPIDRERLAGVLGLDGVTENSMDGVSDRDFVAEFLFCAALVGSHISRLAEDLILYSGPGYRFVRIGEAYTTGSSLMPQKRNPDSLELARGKSGRLLGDLMAMLVVLKGLPSTYNKDLQEDKQPIIDAADTLAVLLPVMAGVVGSLEVDAGAMRDAMDEAMLATDLADYLVRRGVAFREAHHLVGRLVKEAEGRGVALSALPLGVIQGISERIGEDVYGVFDVELSVRRRVVRGGTAPEAVRRQMAVARGYLQEGEGGGG